jgi:hypothetical protein
VLGSITQLFTLRERARNRQRLIWLAGGSGALMAGYFILMAVEFWQRSRVA